MDDCSENGLRITLIIFGPTPYKIGPVEKVDMRVNFGLVGRKRAELSQAEPSNGMLEFVPFTYLSAQI